MKPVLYLVLLATSFPAFAAKHSVEMKSISFSPKQLEIKAGDEVEWLNVSYTDHSATSDSKIFDTGSVAPKKASIPVVFKEAGTFPYHCRVHGKSMSGVISVKAGS